ncbi:hypothetical protein [Dankookia sp. P2]|uniref:hypothetical protein n=1 Tax=Dankookia sp. P2 TaxID=3423955 RepID=UPI003D677015
MVRAPSGAGHVVALFSPGSLAQVLERLRQQQGDGMAWPFAIAVRDAVRSGEVSSAVFGFFS